MKCCSNNQNSRIFGEMDKETLKIANLLYLYFLDYIVDGNEEEYPHARSLFSNPIAFHSKFFGESHDIVRANVRYSNEKEDTFKKRIKSIVHPSMGHLQPCDQGHNDHGDDVDVSKTDSDF